MTTAGNAPGMTFRADPTSRRLSWRGILAGWVVGLVTTLSLVALGAAITSWTGVTLTGVGIAAALWTALAMLVGAWVAGLTAVRASVPAATHRAGLEDDGIAAMNHDDATLTGLVTGGLIVLLSTLLALNSASMLLNTASNLVGSVVGGAANVATTATNSASPNTGMQDFFGNISQEDVANVIADNSQNLNQTQVNAAASVIAGIIRRTQYDLGQQDITSITNFAQARTDAIRKALSGPQFITRLERQGLSTAQAQEVQSEVNTQVTRMQQQAAQAVKVAETATRNAASTAGWSWLLGAGLTLLAAVMGARSAATSMRPRVPATVQTAPDRVPRP